MAPNIEGSTTLTTRADPIIMRGDYLTISTTGERYRVRCTDSYVLTTRRVHSGWRETWHRTWENWVTFPLDDVRAWWQRRQVAS